MRHHPPGGEHPSDIVVNSDGNVHSAVPFWMLPPASARRSPSSGSMSSMPRSSTPNCGHASFRNASSSGTHQSIQSRLLAFENNNNRRAACEPQRSGFSPRGFCIESPRISMRCALWTMPSGIPSAAPGSPICSCHRGTGSREVRIRERKDRARGNEGCNR